MTGIECNGANKEYKENFERLCESETGMFFFKKVPESDNSDKSEPSTSSSSAYAACAADRVVKVSSKTKKRQYNDSSIAIITEYFINLKSQHNQHEQVMKKDAKEST